MTNKKIIPRKELSKLVELGEIMRTGDHDEFQLALNQRIPLAQKLNRETGVDWISFLDLLDALQRTDGFLGETTMEDVERVLSVLGWQVSQK